MSEYERIRKQVADLLTKEFPAFEYNGHGMNIGIWEMEEMVTLAKPIGDFWAAKFRLWVHIPNQYGQEIKVEANIISCYEWETMFEGYIADISHISHILNFQLGLPKTTG